MAGEKKLRLALIFGGRSTEHEVSLESALGILAHLDRRKYELFPVKIDRSGEWMLLEEASLSSITALDEAAGTAVLAGSPGIGGIYTGISGEWRSQKLDVIFPIVHGTFGEDGTLQGLLSMSDLPCVGAGVMASAACMDKIIMKQLFFQNDLLSTNFIHFLRSAWEEESEKILIGVAEEIGFPCFVKPANTGSSVGVLKAKEAVELSVAIDNAASYDRKILVEEAVDARELECSVLGNDAPITSEVGEVISGNEFYDYEAKYSDIGSQTLIPADISESDTETIQTMAVKAFKALDCSGMGRVDFLMDRKTNEIYVNEINTLPGFTPISMYPKLWEASGMPFSHLLDRLIDLALQRHKDISRSRFYRS